MSDVSVEPLEDRRTAGRDGTEMSLVAPNSRTAKLQIWTLLIDLLIREGGNRDLVMGF